MYEWEHGDVVYYDEPGFSKVWIGVITKHVGDFGTRVHWWGEDRGNFLEPQLLPGRGVMYLVGTVNEDWIEWDV